MEEGYLELNKSLKENWKHNYIDLIDLIIDNDQKVPVFTNDCKFISQDTRHLTKAGAQFFADILEKRPDFILNQMDIFPDK